MTGLVVLAVLPILAALAVLLILLVQLLGQADVAAGGDDPAVRGELQRIRRRLGGCLLAAVLVLVGGVLADALWPDATGLPLTLAPGLAAGLALLGFAVWPTVTPAASGQSSATLGRREAWSYGSGRSLLVPAALAIAYLALLAGAAVVASPDDAGLMRSFSQTQGALASSAGPFPGSFYGIPLAVVTVLLMASTYAALRRIASSATVSPAPVGGAAAIDRRWREIATRVVVRLSTSALLGYAGASMVFAGSAMRRASTFAENGGYDTVWSPIGAAVAGAGLVAILAAAVVGGAAVAAVLSLRSEAVRPPNGSQPAASVGRRR